MPLDWVTVVMGDTARRALRPADVGVALDRADGQRRARGVPRHPGEAADDGGPAAPGRRGRGRRSTRASSGSDGTELLDPEVLDAGLGRLGGEITGLGEARKEAEPDHPLGGSAAFFEFNCTAIEASVDEETGDITIHRHVTVSDVGKALNPLQVQMQDEGAAIMGLGHTLMEHVPLRRRGPDPQPGRDRLPDPDLDGPAPTRLEQRDRGERRRPRPVRRQGHERGRAAVRGAGRRGRRSATRPASGSGTCRSRPERVWRALQEREARRVVTWVYASDAPPAGSADERVLLLGGKAANLATMAVDLGLPVPPAFTITTEACRAYLAARMAGWPGRRSSARRWRRSRRGSGGGSGIPRTRCWSRCGRGRRGRCPG